MIPSSFGLWTYLFGVANLKFNSLTSFAPKALYLDNDGNCFLFDALQKCTYGDNEKQKEAMALMSDIRSNVLWLDELTDDQRMFHTYEKLHGFFVRHPEWLNDCANTAVYNGITVQNFIKAGKMFKQMHNLKKVLGGNPSLLVEYLSMLQDEPTLDESIREQIRLMVDNLNDYFVKEPRIFKRLSYVADQTVELLNPQKNGAYIEIELGTWGQFDDLLELYAYYKKHGWHDSTDKSAHCALTQSLIRLRSDNHTILTDTIQQNWKQWKSLSYRTDFKGYIKRMQKIVEGGVEGLTSAQKLVEIAKILNNFQTSKQMHKEIMEIDIQNWGTVQRFTACQQVPDNESV